MTYTPKDILERLADSSPNESSRNALTGEPPTPWRDSARAMD